MFENHFGFIRRPFTSGPDVELFVNNEAAQSAFESIDYCLRGGQGIAVLTAPTGTGKSMLCQVLISELRDEFQFSFLPSPGTSSRLGLLQAIYFGLGKRVKRRHAGIGDAEMRVELINAVRSLRVRSTGLALLIDEAHLLDNDQLEEIRILSSFADRGQPLIRPLLCGAPSLEERLLDPELKALSQRIRCQVYLESLTRDESELFIHHQLTRAGVQNRHIFEPGAVQKIVQAADGNPRCLNQLCDQSLFLAAKAAERTVTEDIVEEALDTLVQLPLSWNRSLVSAPRATTSDSAVAATSPASSVVEIGSSNESVIEFGSLDDDDDVQSTAVVEIGSDDELCESIDTGDQSDEESAAVEAADQLQEQHVEQQEHNSLEDEILIDDPVFEPAVGGSDYGEELSETFRRGLPEAPVPFNEQRPDSYELADECDSKLVPPVNDLVELKPRFDGAVSSGDLLPQSHSGGRRSQFAREAQTVAFGERSRSVEDQWSERTPTPGQSLETSDGIGSAEEQLLQSCIDTRRDIATMLDTLESHVSEGLADRYDVVMPERDDALDPSSERSQDSVRLSDVIERERLD